MLMIFVLRFVFTMQGREVVEMLMLMIFVLRFVFSHRIAA